MKKVLSLALCALLVVGLTACGSSTDESDELIKIGIVQPLEHDALSLAREGFMEGLAESGYGEDMVDFTYLNALGQDSDLKSMCSESVRSNDMTLGIGTGCAQSLQSAASAISSDNPIMFTAVTDPVSAGLIDNVTSGGTNMAGTTDMNPVAAQVNLITEVLPNAKTIGIIYTASEQNSEIQANVVKETAEALGLEVVVATINTVDELNLTLRDLCGKVDCIYIPTDNKLAANMATVSAICNEEKVMTVVGESSLVENGGCLTLSIDYFELGKLTGVMAAEILDGTTTTQDMPLGVLEASTYALSANSESLEACGITLPDSLLERLA